MQQSVSQPLLVQDVATYQTIKQSWQGQTIALVPTMGALHEGHAALIRHARGLADKLVVSIFVNPTQFGPTEDYSQYPRPFKKDLALCAELGVDVVFHPTVEIMYPGGYTAGLNALTVVLPPATLTSGYCGAFRAGHFTGVATVVLKLFNLIQPHYAVFGEKDAQQLSVIQRMVEDLNVPVSIVPYPTVRNAQGLALSSRNQYLKTPEQKEAALCLWRMMNQVQAAYAACLEPIEAAPLLQQVSDAILSPWKESSVNRASVNVDLQYFSAVNPLTFEPVTHIEAGVRLLVAAKVDAVRLIDTWLIQN